MTTCKLHDMLLGQRIPPLSADNTAPEAICRIPVKVPKMAPFDTVLVYQLTIDEQHAPYEPVYWNFAAPDAKPTKDDECAYEVDTSKDSFAWVSWVERTRELQKQRIWICEGEHLICNGLDSEFKRPNIPLHVSTGDIQVQMPPTTVFDYEVSSEELSSFDFSDEVFISSIVISWDPPSWDAPSWDPPNWTEPSFDCSWCAWEPVSPPEWWSSDFEWCEQPAPDWYNNVPEWYKESFKNTYYENNLKCKYKYFDVAGYNDDIVGLRCPQDCVELSEEEQLEGLKCRCRAEVNPGMCEKTEEEKNALAEQAFNNYVYGKQPGGADEQEFVDQYIANNLTCSWEAYTTSDEAAANDVNCQFVKECNGVNTYECSSMTNEGICALTDAEKSSIAQEAYLHEGANWCYDAPPWLHAIPLDPDIVNDAGDPDDDNVTPNDVVDAACNTITTVLQNGTCLQTDETGCKPSIKWDEECIKEQICAKVSATFGIKKSCDNAGVHLDFDPSVLKSTECFVIDLSKYNEHPRRGEVAGTSGIRVYVNPSTMFKLDPSLAALLKLEQEDNSKNCSKMIFKKGSGEKGGFVLVKGGKLTVLSFPNSDSILTAQGGGSFAWEGISDCSKNCKKKDGGG